MLSRKYEKIEKQTIIIMADPVLVIKYSKLWFFVSKF